MLSHLFHKKNKLEEWYFQNYQHFRDSLKEVGKQPTRQNIHKLRLHIKHLKSLLTFFEIVSGRKFLKRQHLLLLQPVFRTAGVVREAQVNLSLIDNSGWKHTEDFRQYLRASESSGLQDLQRIVKKFPFRQWRKFDQQLIPIISKIDNVKAKQQIMAFVDHQIRHVLKPLIKAANHENYHKIRKKIRVVREMLVVIDTLQWSEQSPKWENKLKKLTQLTGEWHDDVVLEDTLQHFYTKQQIISSPKLYEQTLTHLENRINALSNKLSQVLSDFIQEYSNLQIPAPAHIG